MELTTVWFLLIGILWTGYFFLEGFDFGVGMLLHPLGRTETDRRILINTIGPVWDGNEVWLITAGGATFAAFPNWYATLFSGFYLALFLILVALILRGVAFEYRGKVDNPTWRHRWDLAIAFGSWVPAVLWGVAFANIVRGVPINADGDFTGSLLTLLNPFGLLGGVVTASLFLLHGLHFVILKTEGPIRDRAQAMTWPVGAVAVVAGAVFLDLEPARAGRGLDLGPGHRRRGRAGAVARGDPRRARRLGLRRDRAGDRHGRARPVRVALPRCHAVHDRPGVQPHGRQRELHAVHAAHHDVGSCDHDARGPRVSGMVVLGVPPPHRRAAHPGGARARAGLTAPVTVAEPSAPRGPLDPRILGLSPALRRHLVACAAASVVVAGAILVQAEVLSRGIPRLVDGDQGAVGPIVAWVASAAVIRAVAAALMDRSATSALLRTRTSVRDRILDRLPRLRLDQREALGPARVGALTSTALDALEPWVRTYLPALTLAVAVPLAAGFRILLADRWSAMILVIVVPLVPFFMVLIGRATENQAAKQWDSLQRLAGRFLDVITGLPTLRLFGRADAQVSRVREVTERYRQATMRTLRVAFLSAMVLELLATLTVALVAVVARHPPDPRQRQPPDGADRAAARSGVPAPDPPGGCGVPRLDRRHRRRRRDHRGAAAPVATRGPRAAAGHRAARRERRGPRRSAARRAPGTDLGPGRPRASSSPSPGPAAPASPPCSTSCAAP